VVTTGGPFLFEHHAQAFPGGLDLLAAGPARRHAFRRPHGPAEQIVTGRE
jgi:hypothetical protein